MDSSSISMTRLGMTFAKDPFPAEPPVVSEDSVRAVNPEDVSMPDRLEGRETPRRAASEPSEVRFTPLKPPAEPVLGDQHIDSPVTSDETPVGPLDSREQRLAVLNRLGQLDGLRETKTDEERCGAAAITGAMLLHGGQAGLQTFMQTLHEANAGLPPDHQVDLTDLQGVQARLSDGTALQFRDLSIIQDAAFRVMDSEEGIYSQHHPRGPRENPGGLTNRTLAHFIQNTPAIREAFTENGGRLLNVSLDGGTDGGHFVYQFSQNSSPLIYDPYPRRDGQIIQSPEGIQAYLAAQGERVRGGIGPNGIQP